MHKQVPKEASAVLDTVQYDPSSCFGSVCVNSLHQSELGADASLVFSCVSDSFLTSRQLKTPLRSFVQVPLDSSGSSADATFFCHNRKEAHRSRNPAESTFSLAGMESRPSSCIRGASWSIVLLRTLQGDACENDYAGNFLQIVVILDKPLIFPQEETVTLKSFRVMQVEPPRTLPSSLCHTHTHIKLGNRTILICTLSRPPFLLM